MPTRIAWPLADVGENKSSTGFLGTFIEGAPVVGSAAGDGMRTGNGCPSGSALVKYFCRETTAFALQHAI
jgi:hypothetical protein